MPRSYDTLRHRGRHRGRHKARSKEGPAKAALRPFLRAPITDQTWSAGEALAASLKRLLLKRGESLALGESCTGGLASFFLTSPAGASRFFLGSVMAYSDSAKTRLLKVSPKALRRFGAVSEDAALSMAKGAQRAFSADFGMAVTGFAGPSVPLPPLAASRPPGGPAEAAGGALKKGAVCFALCYKVDSAAQTMYFKGGRQEVRLQAGVFALSFLLSFIKKQPLKFTKPSKIRGKL